MTLTADLIAPRKPSEPEQTMYETMQRLGNSSGESYERIWDSRDRVIETTTRLFVPRANELSARIQADFTKRHIISVLMFTLGLACFVAMGASGGSSIGTLFLLPWLGFSFGWGYSLWRHTQESAAFKLTAAERQNWLVVVGLYAALEAIGKRQDAARSHIPTNDSALPFTPTGSMPLPQPYGVSHEGAEALCAEWMRFYGEADADVTRFTSDGGIDVTSLHYIAQVKNYAGTVGVEAIREMAGVALDDGRRALFFTSGAYAKGAVSFADRVGMPLFVYDALAGTLSGANGHADAIFSTGL